MNLLILLLSSLVLVACTAPPVAEYVAPLQLDENVTIVENNTVVPEDPIIERQSTISLLEGDSISTEYMTLVFLGADESAEFQLGTQQFLLGLNELRTIGNMTITLLAIEYDAKTESRRSFVDVSARIFGVGGTRELIAQGENRSYEIGNNTYNLTLLFVGLDNARRNAALFLVNGDSQTLHRREDRAVGGLYLFVHEIYRVREGATMTRDMVTLKINHNQ